MKSLEEVLDAMGVDRPHKEIPSKLTSSKIEVKEVKVDLRQIQAEITGILSSVILMLRCDDEDKREQAAQDLEAWLANANPVKH